jgi:hypothetical protein
VKNYSIVRIGHEYVVQADEKSILKVASRRKAAKLVTSAAELLGSQPAPQVLLPQPPAEASVDRDPRVIPDPRLIPDAGVILGPQGIPIPDHS